MTEAAKTPKWLEEHGYTLITPELASEWLTHNTQNRHIREKFVRELMRKISAGEWQPMTLDAIGFYEDGTLANGQHRLLAISRGTTPVYAKVEFNIPKSAAIAIDTGKSRSAADNIKILTGKNFYTSKISNMINLCADGAKNKSLTPEDHYKIMQRYEDDIVFVKELFDGLPRYISSASIMASVFLALHSGVERQKLHDFVTLLGASVAKNEVDGVVILFQNKVFSEYFTKTKKQRNNYSWEIKRCENIIYHYCNGNVLNTIPSVQNYRYPLIRFDLD